MANYGASRQRTVAANGAIDLNRVRVFIHVVEDGSFTAAAARLAMPKSSVSRSITALERSLGVRLMQRTTRALNLTDAGRTYFQQVRPALASLSDSAASVRALGTEPRGRVRVTAPPEAEELLCTFIGRFKKKYPLVQIDASFSSRRVDLVAEGFDVAMRAGELKDSSLIARKVVTNRFGLFASAGYLRRRGTPKSVADLAGHECIGMNTPTGRAVWTLQRPDGKEESVEVKCSLTTDLLQFAARSAAEGLGIAMLPELMTSQVPDLLQRVLPQYGKGGGDMNIVSPSRAFEPLAVSLFKDGLAQMMTELSHKRCGGAARKMLAKSA